MRTKNFLKHQILGALLMTTTVVVGQSTTPGNVASSPGDFLGWENNPVNNFPLEIRHDLDQPIDFWTTQSFRARINPKISYPIGTAPSAPRNGFMLLSGQDNFPQDVRGPFTRLHLVDDVGTNLPIVYAQDIGYRQWMRNGITFTGNSDQAYIGQKYNGNDNTDFVIQWSDNPDVQPWGTDRMKFIFSSAFTGDHTGMGSEYGLEAMRFWPKNAKEVNVGVGDFYAYGGDPTERLHVRDGRVRIQQLPDEQEAPELTKFLVVDDSPGNERGVVKWRNLPVVPPASSCDWTLNPTGQNNVSTAFGLPDPDCPDDLDAVGIGVDLGSGAAPAKLVVGTTTMPRGASISATMPTANNHGLVVDAQGGTANNYGIKVTSRGSGGNLWRYGVMADVTQGQSSRTRGVYAETDGATYTAYAGFFQANDSATWTRGISARAMNGGITAAGVEGRSHAMAQRNTGVLGVAADVSTSILLGGRRIGVAGFAHSNSADMVCYGVYGRAGGADDPNGLHGHTKWAGYFQGYTYTPGSNWSASDVQLKQNIAELRPDSAASWLMQLAPKSYDFNREQYPFMGLPSEHQYGLISQEVEQVLPELVTNIHQPAMLDSAGMEASPTIDFKAMNYQGFIPLLIAGFQAQQQQIAALQQDNVAMQQQLAQCCAANQGMAPQDGPAQREAQQMGDLQEQRLLIIPNPVADLTTLEYYVPKAGKVSLSVSTSDGKPLGTLREEQAEPGSYSYQWNTTKLAAGTYICTYLLDGAVIVKRAVKMK